MDQTCGLGGDVDVILNVAEAVFAQFGVHRANAQDVADGAGISRSTLYRRFPSKEDLFVAAADRQLGRLMDDLQSVTLSLSAPEVAFECLTRALQISEYVPLLSRIAQIEPDRLVRPASRTLLPTVKRHLGRLESILGRDGSGVDRGEVVATSGFLLRVSVGALICGGLSSSARAEMVNVMAQCNCS